MSQLLPGQLVRIKNARFFNFIGRIRTSWGQYWGQDETGQYNVNVYTDYPRQEIHWLHSENLEPIDIPKNEEENFIKVLMRLNGSKIS